MLQISVKLHQFLNYKYFVTEIDIAACLLPSRILGLIKVNCMEQAYFEKLTISEIVKEFPEFNRKISCSPMFTAVYHFSTL